MHLACRRGSVELVEIILAYKEADVDILDKDGDPPIVFALAAGSAECVRALINKSANVCFTLREGCGPSLAHVCAFHGQPECMRVCLLLLLFCFLFIFFLYTFVRAGAVRSFVHSLMFLYIFT